MLKVIGKENCNACIVVKNTLNLCNIPYEYSTLEELSEEERNKYIKMAEDQGRLSLPLIIDGNELKILKEVI